MKYTAMDGQIYEQVWVNPKRATAIAKGKSNE